MACCAHCKAIETQFGPKMAERDLARYRRKGPDNTTRLLLDAIRSTSPKNVHLLDVGAGIGVIRHELLGAEVGTVTHVEPSPAYIAVAKAEDERRGHADRVTYVQGDIVDLGERVPDADTVTLDRVICCYPDWEGLVRRSASKARAVYAFSVPHDRWWTRLANRLENLSRKLRGNAFRTFVHPVDVIDQLLRDLGFRQHEVRRTFVWHVAIYRRAAE